MPRKIDPGTLVIGVGTNQESTLWFAGANFTEHVTTTSGAHVATAISIDGHPAIYESHNVEGALDELSALVPPRPAMLGSYRKGVGVSGAPDWGVLKLADSSLDERPGAIDWGVDPAEVYGYYYTAPVPRVSVTDYSVSGSDDTTDPVFNVNSMLYPGGGPGEARAGAFTRVSGGGTNPITQSMRLLPAIGPAGGKRVIVSGIVHPADRGVLALLHWPANGDVSDFLAQNLEDRCLAALLLGNGINSGSDGTPGGIYAQGSGVGGVYDPFAFPGAATGQYDLEELHTGLSTVTGAPLPIVADSRAGQVRLGASLAAGVPVLPDGLLILGGGVNSSGGGSAGADSSITNFFRYRLPYLSQYDDTYAGLSYTPTEEKPRYYMKPVLSDSPSVDLTQAGNYTNFAQDYWTFQVGRYRHSFEMDTAVLGASVPREDGSFMLLHFKTEAAFEALVRDGILPTSDTLYSNNLADWNNIESPENIAVNDTGFPQDNGYAILRSAVLEDPTGFTAPVVPTHNFSIQNGAASDDALVTYVSGVAYFSPGTSDGAGFVFVDNINVDVTGLFENTYHTKDPGVALNNEYLGNMNPVVLSMSAFSYETQGGVPSMAAFFPYERLARQRIEFSYNQLGSYTVLDGPLPADTANIATGLGAVTFSGDIDEPSFSSNAKMRLFVRRPLGHRSIPTTIQPYPSVAMEEASGVAVLFHSTSGGTSHYGNIETAPGSAIPSPNLETALKDTEERFLDEVYRYSSIWSSGGLPVADGANLDGPGLPHGVSDIEVPVRAGTAAASWNTLSWFQLRHFTFDLGLGVPGFEAQVCGLPERAPALQYPLLSPFPSRGILMYPQINYSAGYRPSLAAGDLTSAQWDYSGLAGDRYWNRAFDAGFTASGTLVTAEEQPFLKLKIWGLMTTDYGYVGPDPGGIGIAILVKVPGRTTWMDVGRLDGSGPSKQDPALDGAGCKINDADTFNGVDAATGIVYSQVKISTAPTTFFRGNNLGEVPVLVRVIIKDNGTGKGLRFMQTSATGNPASLRGLVGIEVLRP